MEYLNEKTKKYWSEFSTTPDDLEYLFNYLLELENPQTVDELTSALISHRLELLELNLSKITANSLTYLPKEVYSVGQIITFPELENQIGKVISVRLGQNPQFTDFDVIEVDFGNKNRYFAARLQEHDLNTPKVANLTSHETIMEEVLSQYGEEIKNSISALLQENDDLVLIAGKWFPRSLLVHVNAGHLNLAEALLEEANGGPLQTKMIIDQVELPKEVNAKLIDFSIDLALQEDGRFDEVGALGQTYWYLKRLEPLEVQRPPIYLEYNNEVIDDPFINSLVQCFEGNPCDEFEPGPTNATAVDETSVALIFPHWRAGTLPLTSSLARLFPTSIETSRILFDFIDNDAKKSFSGWVVRPFNYVFGLMEWYKQNGLIPGSIIHLRKSEDPRKIYISIDKKKQNREWIKSVIIGSDNEIVFAILKQPINASLDERLAIFIPEFHVLDNLWNQTQTNKIPFENLVIKTIRELSKLNPQGHVHVQELYAAINIWRRCAPKPLIKVLTLSDRIKHVGDLYFRLVDS